MTLADRACPKCSFNQPRRLPRTSWIERRFMPWFGLYPWECPLCRLRFYRKNRIDPEERMKPEGRTPDGRMKVQPRTDYVSQEMSQ